MMMPAHPGAGDQIPLVVRILTVPDVFDALVSERPYRAAWPVERAIGYLRDAAGTKFDSLVVEALAAATETGWRPMADGLILNPEAVQATRRPSSGNRRPSLGTLTIWPTQDEPMSGAQGDPLVHVEIAKG
jgi:hypothetical protein